MDLGFVFGVKGQNLLSVLNSAQFQDFFHLLPKEYVEELNHNHILENNLAFCVSGDIVLGFVIYELRPEGLFVFLIHTKKDLQRDVILKFGRSIGELLIKKCLDKHQVKTILFSSTTPKADRAISRNTNSKRRFKFHNTTKPK
jgi:hypothetical protein